METKTFFAQDIEGNALPLAAVTVYLAGTTTIAEIFDENGDPKSNPFQAMTAGAIVFGAANGVYDIAVQEYGGTATRQLAGVRFFDPADAVGTDFASAAQGAKADSALQDPAAFATAAQGEKADSAVQPARAITVGTGLTGGGDLSENRQIAADIASEAEALAGEAEGKLMNALRTAQAIDARTGIPAPVVYTANSAAILDVLNIPDTARRIILLFSGWGHNTAGAVVLQLGTASGPEGSGYEGTWADIAGGGQNVAGHGSYFLIGNCQGNTWVFSGRTVLERSDLNTNEWLLASNLSQHVGANGRVALAEGRKSLSGTLDRVRVAVLSGAFVYGKFSVIVEK